MMGQHEPPGGVGPPDDRAVVVLEGDLDWTSASIVQARLGEAVERAGTEVVVDCANVTFVDSMGLRLLLTARNEAASNGARLVVREPSSVVQRVLEITALDRVLLEPPT